MTKDKLIVDTRRNGLESAYIVAHLGEAKKKLESNGYNLVSLEQMAKLRLQEGKHSKVSRNAHWTKEGIIYIPKRGYYLTKNSPILGNVEKAIECSRNDTRFYLTSRQVEEALADSCKIIQERNWIDKEIPTSSFAEEELTVYAFGEYARAYGEFLKKNKIQELKIYTSDYDSGDWKEAKPYARQMAFNGVGTFDSSRLIGHSDNTLWEGMARGVRMVTAGNDIYNLNNFKEALEAEGIGGDLEKRISERLSR